MAAHIQAIGMQVALLKTMGTFRKPQNVNFCTSESKLPQLMTQTEEAGRKDRKSPADVMKVLTDAFNVYYWIMTPGNDMLSDHCQEVDSQVLFYGNRIRKKGKAEETEFFEAFYSLFTAVTGFLKEHKETICDWKGTQDGAGAAAFYNAECSGGGTITTPEAPAQVTAAPVEEEKKQAPAKAAPAKAAGAKAPAAPIKEKRGAQWVCENFTDETIRFDDPEEVNKRVSFAFFNCNKCKIELVGKCQNVNIQSCKNTEIHVDRVVSQVEMFKCQAMKVYAKN